ncbi:MAG: hypothetical protein JO101_06145 [Candidatus Eremiobacteraeota bacterium]|nr:hypothetical protein [Candidatus Eremiobacteraeota bacterium]MBV8354880.1 hypothetical protein [Candidatus Eremiobacteraeota bacterium]
MQARSVSDTPAERLEIAAPRSLREALAVSLAPRERIRWLIGSNELFGFSYSLVPRDSYILDARGVSEFTAAPRRDGERIRFGAFAREAALQAPSIREVLFGATPRMLALLVAGAFVEVASLGRLRSRPLDALVLAPYEAPVSIVFESNRDDLRFERRRSIRDGEATHEIEMIAALRLLDDGRVRNVRIGLAVDGKLPVRARLAEHALEGQRLNKERCLAAARGCAEAIVPASPQAAAAARSALPLAVALLREAQTHADGSLRKGTRETR